MTLVLVDRDQLDALLRQAWELFTQLADISGYPPEACNLLPESELVQLACQAGLPIPGPMAPGIAPPPPSFYHEPGDHRLRCTADGKVVYQDQARAEHAARMISQNRQAMRAYQGDCGHWHLSRVKHRG